jgi:hypothetical protein
MLRIRRYVGEVRALEVDQLRICCRRPKVHIALNLHQRLSFRGAASADKPITTDSGLNIKHLAGAGAQWSGFFDWLIKGCMFPQSLSSLV